MGGQISKPAEAALSPRAVSAPPTIDEKRAALASVQVAATQSVGRGVKGFASIPSDELDQWAKALDEDPSLQMSRLVLSQVDPVAALASRQAVLKDQQVFNLPLKGVAANHTYPTPRVAQGSSGRCWLFATTNVIRYNVIDTLNLGDFQLSQCYLFFHDKLEKSNYYLENILDLGDERVEDQLLSHLNSSPIGDGGQWDMAVNILEKYGMVPAVLYPESFSSMASGRLNTLLTSRLREFAAELHTAASSASLSLADRRARKAAMMREVYSTLCLALGTPPSPSRPFTWEYHDVAGKFHTWTGTPGEFYRQFSARKGMKPEEAFSLVDDPRNEKGKLYTVERLGNVWGGKGIRYVNVDITDLEDAVIASIKADQPVFFGCDSGKSSEREHGLFDDKLYDLQAAYGWKLGMNKEQRLKMGDSSMTHAMVFTAVHLDASGRPVRYRVENSWGEAAGDHGWFLMSAGWFREYVYQVVVPRKLARPEWVRVLDEGKAEALKPWDPMGTLA